MDTVGEMPRAPSAADGVWRDSPRCLSFIGSCRAVFFSKWSRAEVEGRAVVAPVVRIGQDILQKRRLRHEGTIGWKRSQTNQGPLAELGQPRWSSSFHVHCYCLACFRQGFVFCLTIEVYLHECVACICSGRTLTDVPDACLCGPSCHGGSSSRGDCS